ncbi:MAG: glycoside hydrolase family 3 C-terminal domain-containing protein [Bacteroidaceae bacterium]|jgi:beta-glucosidase|nr:glycoside hydrolase family 3 C-terminal domain-containing protein [Bacteroidaceae bacterium]
MNSKTKFLAVWSLLLLSFSLGQAKAQDMSAADNWAKEKLSQMTLDEKIAIIGGTNGMDTKAIDHLGIPKIHMSDGPQGVREKNSTAYPCAVMLAATWNDKLAHDYGYAMGRDCRARNVNIILGPAVNIYRSPLNGRNFEYMGEDPFLTSRISQGYIEGVQSNKGVIACIKHFAANNPEYQRTEVSSDVDERTLNEIYLPAFKNAVQNAKVGSIMSSYNLINGVYTAENKWLMHDMLRTQWGFPFLSMTDWGAAKHSLLMVRDGVDLEMPDAAFMKADSIKSYLSSGKITMETLDDKVLHILRTGYYFNLFGTVADKSIALDNKENAQTAYNVAKEGFVLLKNQNNILPFNPSKIKRIAVIGSNANQYVWGGGSGTVYPFRKVTYLEAIQAEAKKNGVQADFLDLSGNMDNTESICFADESCTTNGFKTTYYNNKKLEGTPAATSIDKQVAYNWKATPVNGVLQDNFSATVDTWIKAPNNGTYSFRVGGDDGFALSIDGETIVNEWADGGNRSREANKELKAGKIYHLQIKYFQSAGDALLNFHVLNLNNENLKAQAAKLNAYDAVVVCEGFNCDLEGEGSDRTFGLPIEKEQNLQIATLAKVPVVAVMNAGGNIESSKWGSKVKGLIWAWYSGQEGATALADVLFGNVNPSGKLPMTFEKKAEDNPTFGHYQHHGDFHVKWTEGIFVGYRGYDKNKVQPLYPFGFGLSYTTFKLSGLHVAAPDAEGNVNVEFNLANTGKRAGAEVVQVYVSKIGGSPVARPIKELKQFTKVHLAQGQSQQVCLKLNKDAFKYYDTTSHSFVTDAGTYNILVGTSSRDIQLKSQVKVN